LSQARTPRHKWLTKGDFGLQVDPKRQRYFVVTAGRTGSTLLAAILGDAGADFDLPVPDDWNTARGGAMVLPEIRRATKHFRLAFDNARRKPWIPPAQWIWSWHRSLGKRNLKSALDKAIYVKANDLDLAIPYSVKVGYFPRVIVSYRAFAPHALSYSQMLINWSVETMAMDYDRTYRNAALQLRAYGGCAVSYDDLVNHSRTEWARHLGEVTGLPVDDLLASRARRVKLVPRREMPFPVLYESVERSFAAVHALSGRAWSPSQQGLRDWGPRQETEAQVIPLGRVER
jgi:hypothetical protein